MISNFGEYEDMPTGKQKLRALGAFVGISAVCGLLVGASTLPFLAMGNASAKTVTNVWNAIPTTLPDTPAPQRSVLEDRNGKVFATFYQNNRVPVASSDIAKAMKDAQVSIEDTRFYQHGAMDTRGFLRAVAGGGSSGGGSTITQQLVKNTRLYAASSHDDQESATSHTMTRKIEELKLSQHLEQTQTKDQILTQYLNIVNYGDGTYGVQAAAEHYFGVAASQLTVDQAALLAGIVQNPSTNNPVVNPHKAMLRRDVVLRDMLNAKRITDAQYAAAIKTPLHLHLTNPQSGCGASPYPYFCSQAINALRNDPGLGATQEARDAVLNRGGLVVKTTLDPKAMADATKAASDALGDDNQFATGIAVVQPGTGQIAAIAQNRTWKQTQITYATSGFQNGSTFKPVTLAAALEDGWNIANTMYAPPEIPTSTMTVHNESAHDSGNMTAYDALAMSSNTFFVKMETQVTSVKHVQDMARRLGWTFPSDVVGTEESTTLGTYNVSPLTVANAYATFAAHGTYCNPTWLLSITGAQGNFDVPDSNCHSVMSSGVADTVANALNQTINGSNPNRTGAKLGIGRPAMGKTGTTTNNSAVWFAGGTPQYQTAVWVGDPRGGFKHPVDSLRIYGDYTDAVFGSTAAGPIWQQVEKSLVAGTPVQNFSVPEPVNHSQVVPDVRGLDVHSAISQMKALGMDVSISHSTSGSSPANTVTGQSVNPGPVSGQQSVFGIKIVLTLSNGSDTNVVVGN